jgi:hypothetical protein
MKIGPTHIHDNRCPHCGTHMDCATGIDNECAPKSGDVAICVYCCNWFVFTKDLRVRRPELYELMSIFSDPVLSRIRAVALDRARAMNRQN